MILRYWSEPRRFIHLIFGWNVLQYILNWWDKIERPVVKIYAKTNGYFNHEKAFKHIKRFELHAVVHISPEKRWDFLNREDVINGCFLNSHLMVDCCNCLNELCGNCWINYVRLEQPFDFIIDFGCCFCFGFDFHFFF